ncbi:MAG: hypothetical protein AB1752_03715 [Candidatus Zixiibacteriota bacterium]
MKVWKWIGTATLSVGVALLIAGCSGDPGTPTSPVGSLERSVYDDGPTEYMNECEIQAKDIFGNGGTGMPFEMSCENMGQAQYGVSRRIYDRNGCLIEVQGWMRFTDSGHRYSFSAKTRGCDHDGGKLTVCGQTLGGCREVLLPVALSSPTTVRGTAK